MPRRSRARKIRACRAPSAQLPVIVDLAVVDDRDVAGFVENGLAPAGKINNAEAAHSQRHGGSDQQPVFIRTAMPKRLHHPARNGFGLFGTLNSDDAANSAHCALLYPEIVNSSI